MAVRIETFDDIDVARVRHVGPYHEVGPCFARLSEWVAAIGARPGRVLGIYHDDPSVVAPERHSGPPEPRWANPVNRARSGLPRGVRASAGIGR